MRTQTIFLVLLLSFGLSADNLEKPQKKELETQVKKVTGEAQKLEKAGQPAEARIKYAESQSLIEVKDVADALKHLGEEVHKRVTWTAYSSGSPRPTRSRRRLEGVCSTTSVST